MVVGSAVPGAGRALDHDIWPSNVEGFLGRKWSEELNEFDVRWTESAFFNGLGI